METVPLLDYIRQSQALVSGRKKVLKVPLTEQALNMLNEIAEKIVDYAV